MVAKVTAAAAMIRNAGEISSPVRLVICLIGESRQ
jgi:hypothetical protein